jgi:hypothetical protein
MPAKFPILKKNHILIISIVILLASLIGASPAIYQRFSGRSGSSSNSGDILASNADHQVGGSFSYIFPVVSRDVTYYFPMMAGSHIASVQEGSPVYIANFNHPDAGCNWAGIAGQVFGVDGNPVNGYTIVITGSINGTVVSLSGETGDAQAYGIGGYEIQLSGAPFASSGTLAVNIFDTNLKPVSVPVPLTTYQDCQSNLVLLNFSIKK